MASNNLDQSAQYPSQENNAPLSSDSSEDNVAMPIVRLDEITVEQESSTESAGICSIGIEPQALEAIIYRILVEVDQPLWIDEIIDALKEEMTGIQFTREYLLPILTSSTTIRTFSPYALFTFVLTESQRNTKTKEKIQRSKSNLNSNWDKWVKNGGKTSEAPIKAKKGMSENLVESLNSVSRDEVAEDVVEIRKVDPQKMYRGRPLVSARKSETENGGLTDATITLEKLSESVDIQTENKGTEEILVEKSDTLTTLVMNDLGNYVEKENTPIGINETETPLFPAPEDENIEMGSLSGQEISRWTDENDRTFTVRIADPSELTEEERERLEKYEHDRLTKTPDQIEREKARAAKRKAMGEGTTAFVTSLKTRGSRKTVAIDYKSWGSLFDE